MLHGRSKMELQLEKYMVFVIHKIILINKNETNLELAGPV